MELWHTREVNTELELNLASRETLLALLAKQRAVNAEQQVVIAQLQRRVEALEARLKRRGSFGMPGNMPSSGRQPTEKKEPRKPRRYGFAGLAQWAEAVHQVYIVAKASVLPRAQPGHRIQLVLEEQLLSLARPFLQDPLAVQAKLCRRMERFIKELFVFVSEPAVPSDNNAAERSLRHLVITRKISGGTRSGQGTDSKMTLASLFGTWRARGLNPLLECRRMLISPQV